MLTRWYLTRFRAERDSGYHLLLRSAAVGLVLYAVSWVFNFCIAILYPPVLLFWDIHVPEHFTSEVGVSLVLALIAPGILNIPFDEASCANRTARQFGDHVELFLDYSVRESRMVGVDLTSRKVYVGHASESGIGKGLDADALLVPVFSGHRDVDTLNLVLDVDYRGVLEKFREEGIGDSLDLTVVIPLKEIVAVRLFDLAVYEEFRGVRVPPDGGDPDGEALDDGRASEEDDGWFLTTVFSLLLVLFVAMVAWGFISAIVLLQRLGSGTLVTRADGREVH